MDPKEMAVGADEAPGSDAAPPQPDPTPEIGFEEIDDDFTDLSPEPAPEVKTPGEAAETGEYKQPSDQPAAEEPAAEEPAAEEPDVAESEALREIARLDGEPEKNWRRLREIATANVREVEDLRARIGAFEQAHGFKPTTPADEFKAEDFWLHVATEYPAYYERLAGDVFRSHRDAIPPDVLGDLMQQHVPALIEHTFGMGWDDLVGLVQGQADQPAPPLSAPPHAPAAGAPTSPQDLAARFGLDQSEPIVAFTAQMLQRMAGLESQITQIGEKTQTSEAEARKQAEDARAQEVTQMVRAERDKLLGKIRAGIPKGHEQLERRIQQAVEAELSADQVFQAARQRAEKWARQGNVKDAAGDLKVMFARQTAAVAAVRKELLDPVLEGLRLRGETHRQQTQRKELPGGTNPGETGATNTPGDLSRLTLAERIALRRAGR